MRSAIVLLGLAASASPIALAAQTTAPSGRATQTSRPTDSDSDDGPEITVTGQRERGAVLGDIKPEEQLRAADIRAYGVSSITDLLAELAPLTNSGRGRGGEQPVVLLNGHRISNFNEIRDIPTEAIERVDILPEEVSLKYGYSANQRVVNFVLRRRFRAVTGEITGTGATDGGQQSGKGDFDMLRIRNDGRFSLGVTYNQAGNLTEADRNVAARSAARPYDFLGNVASTAADGTVSQFGVPAAAASGAQPLSAFPSTLNSSNIGDWRTLLPATRSLSINGVYSHPLSSKITATLNATLDTSTSDSLNGPATASLRVPAGDPFSPFGTDIDLYRYIANQAALSQGTSSSSGHIGGTVSGDGAKWRWSLTGEFDHGISRTVSTSGVDVSQIQALLDAHSASFNPFAPIDPALLPGRVADRARSTSNSGDTQAVISGPLFHLPAGSATTSVKIGGNFATLSGASVRNGLAQATDLSRRDANGQVSIDLPITSRKDNILGAIGTLSINFNATVDHYSDFGTLTDYGGGIHYTPRDRIDFITSYTHEQGVPTIQQLGNPQVVTANVPYYDTELGRTVIVSQVNGGNPDLMHDSRNVWKLGLTLKPFDKTDFTITANYINSRTRNLAAALPSGIADAEDAFPDRFTRDASGALTRIDLTPINIASEDRQQFRWGFTFSKPLKTNVQKLIAAYRAAYPNGMPFGAPTGNRPNFPGGGQGGPGGAAGTPPGGGDSAAPGGGAPGGGTPGGGGRGFGGGGGGGGGGRGGGGRFGGGGGQGGRLQLSFFHTWFFQDTIRLRDSLPVIDLLNGGALGTSGGQPRHEFDLRAGYSNNGIGMTLTGHYQVATDVKSGPATAGATGDLHFSGLATANFRLFANLAQMPPMVKFHWVRGVRVSLNVTNIFNQRPKVHDSTGATPLSYQPAYLDPLGRTVSISVRKLFF